MVISSEIYLTVVTLAANLPLVPNVAGGILPPVSTTLGSTMATVRDIAYTLNGTLSEKSLYKCKLLVPNSV